MQPTFNIRHRSTWLVALAAIARVEGSLSMRGKRPASDRPIPRSERSQGTIRFTVSPKGKPEQVQVAQATHPVLGELAAAYVRRVDFKPAALGGASVATSNA